MTAAALTAFLAPFLPVLVKAGEGVVTGVAGRAGDAALGHARRLWERLRPGVDGDPAAEVAAAKAAAAPGDERRLAALEVALEDVLAADPALAADVAALFEQARAAGVVAAVGERSVAVGGSVTGSAILTGDGNRVG